MDPDTWQLPLAATIVGLFVIVMLRANGTYWLGRGIVAGTARTRWARLLDTKAYRVGSAWLNRWGAPAVSISFLTIGVQTMVNLGAGVTRMPLRRYLPAVTIGSVMWAVMYGTVGFIGFVAVRYLWDFSPVLTIVLALAAVAAIVIAVRKRPAETTDEPSEAVAPATLAEGSATPLG